MILIEQFQKAYNEFKRLYSLLKRYDYEKTFVLPDPPSQMVVTAKNKIDPKTKKLKKDVYYLTTNIYYGQIHWTIRWKAVDLAKTYLVSILPEIPKMEKLEIEITYYHPDASFDLDNKLGFWVKVLFDLFKEPTTKQILKSRQSGYPIKTIGIIKDDDCKHISRIIMQYAIGEHKMEITILGRLKKEELKLF